MYAKVSKVLDKLIISIKLAFRGSITKRCFKVAVVDIEVHYDTLLSLAPPKSYWIFVVVAGKNRLSKAVLHVEHVSFFSALSL